jgi:phosphate transport system substrate-binding protein
MKRFFIIFFVIIFTSCHSNPVPKNQPSGVIQIKGSDTLVNAAQSLAEEFMKTYPYIFVAVTGGGSGVGIASLINKTCDIATASRKIKKKEIAIAEKLGVHPKEFTVAYDGVAVIVHKNNPIDKLTIKELHDIYTGKINNWKALGGEDQTIVAISREVSSGTHVYFKEHVVQMGDKKNKQEFASNVLLFSSSQAIVEEVSRNKAAIGYLGMGYISDRVKAIKVSADNKNYYYPDIENVVSQLYPLARPLFMYTNGTPTGVIKIFIDFVLSEEGQQQFKKTGFVPLNVDVKGN